MGSGEDHPWRCSVGFGRIHNWRCRSWLEWEDWERGELGSAYPMRLKGFVMQPLATTSQPALAVGRKADSAAGVELEVGAVNLTSTNKQGKFSDHSLLIVLVCQQLNFQQS